MSRIRKILVSLALVIVSGVIGILLANPVSATPDKAIMEKAYAGLLYRCYDGSIKPTIVNNNQDLWNGQRSTTVGETIFTENAYSQKALLPNGWTNVPDDYVTCRELFLGKSESDYGFSGIVATYGMPNENKAILERLGYDQTMTGLISSGRSCFRPKFMLGTIIGVQVGSMKIEQQGDVMDKTNFDGPELCFDIKTDNVIASTGFVQDKGSNSSYLEITVEGEYIIFNGNSVLSIYGNGIWEADEVEYEIGKTTVDEAKNKVEEWLLKVPQRNVTKWENATPDPETGRARKTRKVIVFVEIEDTTNSSSQEKPNTGTYQFCNNNLICAANRADANIFGSSDRALTNAQVATLYLDYINRYTTFTCNENDQGIKKIHLKIGSEWKDCNIMTISRESFNGVDSARIFGVPITLDDIIKYFKNIDEDEVVDVGGLGENNIGQNPAPPSEDDNNDGNNNDTDPNDVCYGAEGTLGLSWILCPITQMLYDALNSTYDVVENNFLKLEGSELLTNETRDKWSIFQNIANIIFVILLLIVIFSQLTGIGIDNYGIKKILPRLIICAILVNLSFFIAQLLVDASDIIGVSARNIFEHLSAAGGDQATGGAVAGEAAGVGLIAVTAGVTIGAFVLNPALLLSLLLALLTGVISVLMLLVILIARKVGVVVAVIIAPLAFVSYLLPNTSKWLKSWGNLMKGLLILYPLAAGLVGASAFVGNLIGNMAGDGDSGKWMYLAAMLVRVVPFFFLPTLFRRSLNAIGNLGATIQGFGRNLSGGLNRTTRNAEWFRNAQDRGAEHRTRLRAGLDREGNEATGIGRLFRSHNRRARARYRAQYLKDRAAQDDAEMLDDTGYMRGTLEEQRVSRANKIANAQLYNTDGFADSKISQYAEARQSELRKMFTEQNLSRNTTADQRRDRLSELLSNGLGGETDAAEAEALIDLLNDKGDIRQLIDGLNGVSSTQLAAIDQNLRGRIAGRAQATGNALLKGWGKSVNQGNSINIDDYITRAGAGGLNNYVVNDAGFNAFDNADKDTLEFLFRHRGDQAFANGAEQALASMSTSAANSSPRAANAISGMMTAGELRHPGMINEIGSHITAEGLTKMGNRIADTFASEPGSLNNAISSIQQPGNERLLSSVKNDVRNTLGI